MKIIHLLLFFLLFSLPICSQNDVFEQKMLLLVKYHNAIIQRNEVENNRNDSLFQSLFYVKTTDIVKLYLWGNDVESIEKNTYLQALRETLKEQDFGAYFYLETIRTDSPVIWCKRIFKTKDGMENIKNQAVFRIEFIKIQDDWKIKAINVVKDSDFDGIEDRDDACVDKAGISNKLSKCNGCPDYNDNGIPDDCEPKTGICPVVLGISGVVVGGLSYLWNRNIYNNWDTYLKGNNEQDVERNYDKKQNEYYWSQAGIGLGIATVGVGIYCFLKKKKRNKMKTNTFDLSHQYKSVFKKKIEFEVLNAQNGIGIAIKF